MTASGSAARTWSISERICSSSASSRRHKAASAMSWKGGLTLLERGTRTGPPARSGARWRVISAALASIEEGLSLRLRAVRTVIALDLLHSRDAVGLGLGPPRGSRDFDGDRSE